MHLRDFGSLLWVLIVIAGVVSTVRKAGSRSQSSPSVPLGQPSAAPKPAPVVTRGAAKVPREVSVAAQALADAAYRIQLAIAPVAPPPPEPVEQPAAIPAMESFGELSPALLASPSALLLRGRSEWARGVVIAEMLAPPLAMRESGPPTW
ncbi:MAG: hypothetical protein HKL91_07145 [Candidatus Eremiobacteraeota bacterium]|uniref:Uncharacterized protein n=1 Tax=mine drainage metagenome TaxID=410659 RepID=E6PC34_9ZZZZ|nr:hypothetical protein [Candidatus Eremiobacteraeota bacterium]